MRTEGVNSALRHDEGRETAGDTPSLTARAPRAGVHRAPSAARACCRFRQEAGAMNTAPGTLAAERRAASRSSAALRSMPARHHRKGRSSPRGSCRRGADHGQSTVRDAGRRRPGRKRLENGVVVERTVVDLVAPAAPGGGGRRRTRPATTRADRRQPVGLLGLISTQWRACALALIFDLVRIGQVGAFGGAGSSSAARRR